MNIKVGKACAKKSPVCGALPQAGDGSSTVQDLYRKHLPHRNQKYGFLPILHQQLRRLFHPEFGKRVSCNGCNPYRQLVSYHLL